MVVLEAVEYESTEYGFDTGPLNEVTRAVESDERTQALLSAQNVNPTVRLRYNDHGPKHVETVLERAITLYDLLKRGDVPFNGAKDHGLEEAVEPVIIALGAIYHDIGHVVHRDRHSYYSVDIARDRVSDILETVYPADTAATIMGEVLHAIVCHHRKEEPLTREAGVVRVADALDMERGRSRVPYEKGGRGINTISSRAIKEVRLRPGEERPASIEIEMTSAAGIYQVDELLNSKVNASTLEDYLDVVALRSDEDDRLIERFEL